MEQSSLMKWLSQYDMNDTQHTELLQMVALKGSKSTELLIEESNHILDDDSVLRDAWRQDVIKSWGMRKISADQVNSI